MNKRGVLHRSSVSAMRRSSLLAPFRVRNFRFQYDLLTSWGLGWYVLVATGSVLLLILFGSLQYFGTLVAPVLGMAGDRLDHHNRSARCAIPLTVTSPCRSP